MVTLEMETDRQAGLVGSAGQKSQYLVRPGLGTLSLFYWNRIISDLRAFSILLKLLT